jgi:glycosyl transferase family 25
MQVFVINLATARDRLDFMQGQLGGDFERVDAIKAGAIPGHLSANFPQSARLLPGEIACYASHLVIAETILERGLPYAVVLEDDVDLAPDFREVVAAGIERLPAAWDILALSGAKQHPHCRLSQVNDDTHLVRYLHFPKTTAGYVISPSGCRKLLASRPRLRPVDVDIRYGWEMQLDGFGLYPAPAWQTNRFASSIPKSKKQRFYWRADPVGYVAGRIVGVWKLGLVNLMRAYLQEYRIGRAVTK